MSNQPKTSFETTIPLFERLQIESQSNCNRACWFCPRTFDRSGKYLDTQGTSVLNQMPTDKILDLLDQAQAMGFQGRVGFHHYSEPMLDERNIMLATEAKKRNMKPYLHTNGDLLQRDNALCQEVKKVYGLIVVGLYDYKTNEELDQAKQYWHARLANTNLEFSPIPPQEVQSPHSIGIPRALVPSNSRMTVPDLTFSNAPCHRPLIRLIIQHDGEMANCCEDTFGAFHLGNVYRNSLADLWFSKRHLETIENLLAGRRDHYTLCRICPLSPTGPAPFGQKIHVRPRTHKLQIPQTVFESPENFQD